MGKKFDLNKKNKIKLKWTNRMKCHIYLEEINFEGGNCKINSRPTQPNRKEIIICISKRTQTLH